MNQKEKSTVETLSDRIVDLEKTNIKLYNRIDRLVSVLEDDPNSTRQGLISQVNTLSEDVDKLIYMNQSIKKVSMFFLTIVSGIATFVIKMLFFPSSDQ